LRARRCVFRVACCVGVPLDLSITPPVSIIRHPRKHYSQALPARPTVPNPTIASHYGALH
jgi:hypothetical protein